MRIDVHSHYTPSWYYPELERVGAHRDMSILKILGHLWRPTGEDPAAAEASVQAALADRLYDLDRAEVDRQVISIGAAQPYLANREAGVAITRRLNDSYRQYLDLAPTRLWAFGTLPLPHLAESIAEVDRIYDELGFHGIAMGCSAGHTPIDDPVFDPLWEKLNERRAVVYFHPGVEISGVVGATKYHLAPDFVSPAEVAVTAARLIVAGHLDRFPDATIIFATLGGLVPYFARRFDRGLAQDNPERHRELRGVVRHFSRFYYDSSVMEEPDYLRAARDTFGADRILLGSDYSRPGVTAVAAVDFIAESAFLSDVDKHAILDNNHRRVFSSLKGAS